VTCQFFRLLQNTSNLLVWWPIATWSTDGITAWLTGTWKTADSWILWNQCRYAQWLANLSHRHHCHCQVYVIICLCLPCDVLFLYLIDEPDLSVWLLPVLPVSQTIPWGVAGTLVSGQSSWLHSAMWHSCTAGNSLLVWLGHWCSGQTGLYVQHNYGHWFWCCNCE